MREICKLCGIFYGIRYPTYDDREVRDGHCDSCSGFRTESGEEGKKRDARMRRYWGEKRIKR